ncbi:thioredoxin family protein [Bdellovibrio sp. HCB337]|uniref:thioredoxin family protein n=1 Tax=Bdellovibrio sp. HCB337 TaxID=3394358 RepID=UPI0039A61C77
MDPRHHPFFEKLKVTELDETSFDSSLEAVKDQISVVFFWGHNCPNCEVAKNILSLEAAEVLPYNLKWFHVNAYDYMELAKRFGLHGIPVFLFFRNGRSLGKVTTFPGLEDFKSVLDKLTKQN